MALTFCIYANYLITFDETLLGKKIGFALLGIFHLRQVLATQMCVELMSNNHKAMSLTAINFFNSFSPALASIYFLYVDQDEYLFFKWVFYFGIFVSILFVIIVPESPRWLMMLDPESQKGRSILNQIAKINGSKFRVPENTVMDNVY